MNDLYKDSSVFFAAANTHAGFKSLFDDIFMKNAELDRIYILKGGPGVGKSTFMKKAAEQCENSGLTCEKFLCSSDPDSLDAVIIKEKRCAILDGTLPHACEPSLAGAREILVDLGKSWDTEGLAGERENIASLCKKKSAHYSSCYKISACKKVIDDCVHNLLMPYILYEKAYASADRTAAALFKGVKKGKATVEKRLTNAFSCKGKVRLFSFENMSDYCIFLKVPYDGCRLASLYLDEILDKALGLETRILISNAPENPDLIDALCFPDTGVSISLFDVEQVAKCDRTGKKCKIINLSRFIDTAEFSKVRPLRRFYSNLSENLQKKALDELSSAGKIHAALEEIYGKYTDYSTVSSICEKYLEMIF